MTLINGMDVRDPSVRVLDMCRLGPVLNGDPADIGDGPPVTSMLIQNSNPVAVAPDSLSVRRGFAREDLFVCVHEQFMTETAKIADVVLPATTFLEHDDIYQGGGHPHILLGPRVIDPLPEARSNHEVLRELAKRLGAFHPGFEMSAWEIIDETLKRSNYPDAAALKEMRWIDCQPDFDTAHFLNGFSTPGGKFRFKPDWRLVGPEFATMPPLPDYMAVIEETDDDHPFRLVTAPARNYLNSSFTETPTSKSRELRPEVWIHPDDARDRRVSDGTLVVLGNRRGEVRVHAKLFDGLQPGVLVSHSVFPHAAYVGGLGLNALIGADVVPPNGGAAFHDTAVWVALA